MRSAGASDGDGPDWAGPYAALRALRAWAAARDAVLRGLVHALSNRVGTVVAAGALLEAGSADTAGRVLGGEVERLEALLARFRAATADPFDAGAGAEPLVLGDVVGEAVALHAYAAEGRGAGTAVLEVDGAPPVLARRDAVVHAVLVLLAGAPDGVVVRADAGPDGVRLRVTPDADRGAVEAAAWLLTGTFERGGADSALVLPRLGGPAER